MIAVQLNELELIEEWYEHDPTMRIRDAFPLFSATGTEGTAVVYFEVEPGNHLATHTDGAEETLLVIQGRAEVAVGEERGELSEGGMAVVPRMVSHSVRNAGDETLKVVGFFSSADIESTFEHPLMPSGERVFRTSSLEEA